MIGRARRWAALALAFGCAGCIGAPSQLSPGLRGSVGLPHEGVVTDAIQLPRKGLGFERFRDDGVSYGGPKLVATLQRAAAEVARARPGQPPLVIGDLSERRGGQTTRHRSHRTGRDVDLLFYVTTPSGTPIKTPGFVKFGADGLARLPDSKKFVRFDVDRSWLLIRALLTTPSVDVQWIFVSRPLEALITEHARAIGEDMELVWRAEVVLHQPGDSAPHDDHFHVRLACGPDDAVGGCVGGPRRPWEPPAEAVQLTERELLVALFDDG